METLLNIVVIVFALLQIILFFKMWSMTNDIKEIKNKYLQESKENDLITSEQIDDKGFNKGTLVIIKVTEKQFRIVNIESKDGVMYYSGNDYVKHPEGDIALFDEYWKKKKNKSESQR